MAEPFGAGGLGSKGRNRFCGQIKPNARWTCSPVRGSGSSGAGCKIVGVSEQRMDGMEIHGNRPCYCRGSHTLTKGVCSSGPPNPHRSLCCFSTLGLSVFRSRPAFITHVAAWSLMMIHALHWQGVFRKIPKLQIKAKGGQLVILAAPWSLAKRMALELFHHLGNTSLFDLSFTMYVCRL